MARSIKQLLSLAMLDCRFHKGTFKDFSPYGQTVTPQNDITFLHDIAITASTSAINHLLETTLDISASAAFSFEIMTKITAESIGLAGGGRMWANGGGTPYLLWDDSNRRLILNMGTAGLNFGANTVFVGDTIHIVGTGDGGGNCTMYLRSVRGYVSVTGACGSDAITNMSLFNRPAFNRDAPQNCYVFRVFNTELTEEEAGNLYMHSRLVFENPSAIKRSGIA